VPSFRRIRAVVHAHSQLTELSTHTNFVNISPTIERILFVLTPPLRATTYYHHAKFSGDSVQSFRRYTPFPTLKVEHSHQTCLLSRHPLVQSLSFSATEYITVHPTSTLICERLAARVAPLYTSFHLSVDLTELSPLVKVCDICTLLFIVSPRRFTC
jgi:hypothetical protein